MAKQKCAHGPCKCESVGGWNGWKYCSEYCEKIELIGIQPDPPQLADQRGDPNRVRCGCEHPSCLPS